jgi:hypothetical protein
MRFAEYDLPNSGMRNCLQGILSYSEQMFYDYPMLGSTQLRLNS